MPGTKGALLVVTHDRRLLDRGSHQTWEVHDGVADRSEGGYAAYIWRPVERDRITDQQYSVIDGGLRHLPGGVGS